MDETSRVESQRRWAQLGWLAFTLLACGHFSLLYLERSPQFLNLRAYAAGTLATPFQGRILMAWLLHATAGSAHPGPILTRITSHLPEELGDPYILVILIVTYVSLLVAVLGARASLLTLTGDRRFASWAALLTIYMAYFNLATSYGLTYMLPYDVPSLAFFTLGVWLIISQRYWILLPLFAVATLNRETTCFLTIFLALYAWFSFREVQDPSRMRAFRRAMSHIALQTVVWFAIRLWIRHLFIHNPHEAAGGGLFVLEFSANFRSLLKPPQWPLFLSVFGYTLPLVIVYRKWIGKPALERSLMVLLPLWLAAMLLIGVIVEIRIFDELTAFLVPAVALILRNRWILPARRQLYAAE
jgi:hypothetical protein